MGIFVEIAAALLGISLVAAVVIAPIVSRRLRQNEEWIEENNWQP